MSNMSIDERKQQEVQKQIIIVEREAQKLREKNAFLEREVTRLSLENEEMKAEKSLEAGGVRAMEQKVQEEMAKQRLQMQKEIQAYQDTFHEEIEEKDKKMVEMENQLELVERQHEDRIERL